MKCLVQQEGLGTGGDEGGGYGMEGQPGLEILFPGSLCPPRCPFGSGSTAAPPVASRGCPRSPPKVMSAALG